MLERTFQLISGVGPWREKDLWARGVMTWDDFPAAGDPIAVSELGDAALREKIAQARRALIDRELGTLAKLLPPREHWRLYPAFANEAAFFDIETDGRERLDPTVVTIFDRRGIRVFIAGRNIDELPAALAESALWVTFNGTVFDVPVLRRRFPELVEPAAHVDLRFVCRKAKLLGGLKQIEDTLRLGRPPHLRGVNGGSAVELWRAFQESSDIEPLRFLVEYNAYDAIHLRTVLESAFNRRASALGFADSVPVFDKGDVLYDLSQILLGLRSNRAALE